MTRVIAAVRHNMQCLANKSEIDLPCFQLHPAMAKVGGLLMNYYYVDCLDS
jgi:hypothetical protein